MTWKLVYTKQAQKDAKKLASSGLKPKAQELLALLAEDPYRKPPPFEKLIGDLAGAPFPPPLFFRPPLGFIKPLGRKCGGNSLAYGRTANTNT